MTKDRRGKGPTIIDVGARAGVSRMTVSRVINGDPSVRDSTRQAVNSAIRELGYAPNLMARNLATAGELRIGVIYSNPSAAFMSDFLVGVFEEATSAGARLILTKGENGAAPAQSDIQHMLNSGVQGVVLAPPLGESAMIRDMLRQAGLPVAVVAAGRPPQDAINVRIDDRQAAHAMAQHLLALGHRRIGFIVGNPDQSASLARFEGCRDAVAAAGAELIMAQGAFSYGSGLRAAEWLLDGDAPPTAIFASNDDMAAATVSVAHRRHLDVPRDLTVVGFDDTTVATTLWPPLTTIRQPVRQMAAVALDRLIRALRPTGEPMSADHVLPHALIERDSAAPPRRDASRAKARTEGSLV